MKYTLNDRIARFAEELRRTVPHAAERERFLVVLADLVEWSTGANGLLMLSENEHQQSVVSFRHSESGRVAWSAYPKDKGGAKLELFARSRDAFPPELWAEAMRRVRGLSREPLDDESTLRIPFSALKNPAARETAKQVMVDLIAILSPGAEWDPSGSA